MNSTSVKQSLGFFDLPPEILLRILEFTQLNPEASLVPAFGYAPIWNGCWGIPNKLLCSTNVDNTHCLTYCLWNRFSYLKTSAVKCWCSSIPFSLFLVSKQMKAEAEYTLFKFNGFEFFPPRSLDICRYLKGQTEYKLRLIRDLRFTFIDQQYEDWNQRGRKDWRLLLNWIKYSENLRDLRLVIDLQSCFVHQDCVRPPNNLDAEHRPDYIGLYKMVCEVALKVVVISKKLQGLHLRLPYFRLLEKPLEQEVMGSDYDSHPGSGSWKALEQRFHDIPSCPIFPPWHDTAWKEVTSRYRKLLERSEMHGRTG